MNIHLFSAAGDGDIRNIIDASRPYLAGKSSPTIAYLPAASIRYNWLDYTVRVFEGLGRVVSIDLERSSPAEVAAQLDEAHVLYIPGGNTYLLNHRLHVSGTRGILRDRVRNRLPMVVFSAGTIVCGANVVTSNDLNVCASPHFTALGFTSFNFSVHYPSQESPARNERVLGLQHYHTFNVNPVLALEDDANLHMTDTGLELVCGHCWRFDPGQEPRLLSSGPVSVVENRR